MSYFQVTLVKGKFQCEFTWFFLKKSSRAMNFKRKSHKGCCNITNKNTNYKKNINIHSKMYLMTAHTFMNMFLICSSSFFPPFIFLSIDDDGIDSIVKVAITVNILLSSSIFCCSHFHVVLIIVVVL